MTRPDDSGPEVAGFDALVSLISSSLRANLVEDIMYSGTRLIVAVQRLGLSAPFELRLASRADALLLRKAIYDDIERTAGPVDSGPMGEDIKLGGVTITWPPDPAP